MRSELEAVSKRAKAIYDGGEYEALASLLKVEMSSEGNRDERKAFGVDFAVGTDGESRRWVGMVREKKTSDEESLIDLGEGTELIGSCSAEVPEGVSDMDALMTGMAALVSVHCTVPRVKKVGGDVSSFISGKVVVLGSGDLAKFAARGMAALGADVTVVTTEKNSKMSWSEEVHVLPPAVGESEQGFASFIGQFDSLLDTLDQESQPLPALLNSQHECTNYISTYNRAQQIIRQSGILFGPNKVKTYEQSIPNNLASLPISTFPFQFGPTTLQKLLNQNVLFTNTKIITSHKTYLLRTWSLKDFWELTNWPRDADAIRDTRFGLPSLNDLDQYDIFSPVIQITASQNAQPSNQQNPKTNPYVLEIQGIQALNQHIQSQHDPNTLLFLSARYCRTCKSIAPKFTRMAQRQKQRQEDQSTQRFLTFAKAETNGQLGKELAKALDVIAVPAFVMFRNGKRYGSTISVSKLPSKKLDTAIEYLTSGMDWDHKVLEVEE